MTICPRCRLLQDRGMICRSCGSPMDGALPFRNEIVVTKRQTRSLHSLKSWLNHVGVGILFGVTVTTVLEFKVVVLVAVAATLVFGVVPRLRHDIARVAVSASAASLVGLVGPVDPLFLGGLVVGGIVLLLVYNFSDDQSGSPPQVLSVLEGIPIPIPATAPHRLGAYLQTHTGEATLTSWALVDGEDLLLVRHDPRAIETKAWFLETNKGPIDLRGPLFVHVFNRIDLLDTPKAPKTVTRREIAERLGHDVELALPPLPERVKLVVRVLRPGDKIRASGELLSEEICQGYRETSVMTRRLVGQAGHPVILS